MAEDFKNPISEEEILKNLNPFDRLPSWATIRTRELLAIFDGSVTLEDGSYYGIIIAESITPPFKIAQPCRVNPTAEQIKTNQIIFENFYFQLLVSQHDPNQPRMWKKVEPKPPTVYTTEASEPTTIRLSLIRNWCMAFYNIWSQSDKTYRFRIDRAERIRGLFDDNLNLKADAIMVYRAFWATAPGQEGLVKLSEEGYYGLPENKPV